MYKYEDLKPTLFNEDGIELIRKAHDNAKKMIAMSGCVTMGHLMEGMGGDSWKQMAAIDYLVEKGDLREIEQKREPMGQHRIFVRG